MSINSVTNSSLWMSQQIAYNQQTCQADANGQRSGVDAGRGHGAHRHPPGGGMGQALMQTLDQLGLSMPPPTDPSTQSVAQSDTDSATDGSTSQGNSVQQDLHNFMHTLFKAVRSQDQSTTSGNSTTSNGSGASTFNDGLTTIISQLTNGTGSDNSQLSDLQDAFNTLVQDAQQNQSGGSDTQSTQAVDLKTFLTTLQQNLQNFMTPISATGNLINTSE